MYSALVLAALLVPAVAPKLPPPFGTKSVVKHPKVIGRPYGGPVDFFIGFIANENELYGRTVCVASKR